MDKRIETETENLTAREAAASYGLPAEAIAQAFVRDNMCGCSRAGTLGCIEDTARALVVELDTHGATDEADRLEAVLAASIAAEMVLHEPHGPKVDPYLRARKAINDTIAEGRITCDWPAGLVEEYERIAMAATRAAAAEAARVRPEPEWMRTSRLHWRADRAIDALLCVPGQSVAETAKRLQKLLCSAGPRAQWITLDAAHLVASCVIGYTPGPVEDRARALASVFVAEALRIADGRVDLATGVVSELAARAQAHIESWLTIERPDRDVMIERTGRALPEDAAASLAGRSRGLAIAALCEIEAERSA